MWRNLIRAYAATKNGRKAQIAKERAVFISGSEVVKMQSATGKRDTYLHS